MKILKTVFLIFSLLHIASCETDKKDNEMNFSNYLSGEETYEISHQNLEFELHRADYVYIESFGVIDFFSKKKIEKRHAKKKDCIYFDEVEKEDGVVFQTGTMLKHFDFFVDGKLAPVFTDSNGLLRVEVSENAKTLKVELKKRYLGELSLNRLPKSRGSSCASRPVGKFGIRLPIINYSEIKKVEKLIRINFTAKLIRGFRS